MNEDLKWLLTIEQFDAEIVLIQPEIQSLWLRCANQRVWFILILSRCLYSDSPVKFFCDSVSLGVEPWISTFFQDHPALVGFSTSQHNLFVFFSSGPSQYLIWCQKLTLVTKDDNPDIEALLEQERQRVATAVSDIVDLSPNS